MGLLPEREPVKNKYENPENISPLNIERKEVVSPIPTQFKAQVTDDKGQKLITTPEDTKVKITIPDSSKESLEDKTKGSKEDSNVWSAGYWLRIFKKAIYFGWKVVFVK